MTRVLLVLALLLSAAPAGAQTFRRPVACDSCIANWYYFDVNGPSAGRQDWNCGTSTYDYHRGSDFSLAGGNGAIPTGYDVVAMADGVVETSLDGNYDRCNTCDAAVDSRCGTGFGFGYGNYVVINHGSYKTIYAHMRTGSVRVGVGATVRCGDVVGQIGSSGCSTGAHLHIETRPLGGAYTTAFDPFAGTCSSSTSRWTSQGPYRGMPAPTCDGGTVPPTCPSGTYTIWTCNAERTNRRRCIDGVDMIEGCPYGCVSMPVGTDDVCAPPPDADGDGSPAGTDCDDGDASRYPGAPETCGDGVDQDCDGSDLACPVVPMDAGPPPVDGGGELPPVDGGQPTDGGARRDAGAARDAGAPGTDAWIVLPDGSTRRPATLVGTCGCRAGAGASAPAWLLALALAIVLRRRA